MEAAKARFLFKVVMEKRTVKILESYSRGWSMQEHSERVEPLRKIRIWVQSGKTPTNMDLTPDPVPLEFVFGVGSEGLSPFEYRLAGKRPGDILTIAMDAGEAGAAFGRLQFPLHVMPQNLSRFYMRVSVEAVSPASNKEVIQAMADMAKCEHGCCDEIQ